MESGKTKKSPGASQFGPWASASLPGLTARFSRLSIAPEVALQEPEDDKWQTMTN